MTSVDGTTNFTFDKSMFSDPSMRPYLQEYYEESYAPFRERIAAMKEAEASGAAPKTVKTKDGQELIELSADKYEAAIPSFDKWLELQQSLSAFDMAEQSASSVKNIQEALDSAAKALDPDQSSMVRAVFSNGSQILGYITADGATVTHSGGSVLEKISKDADKLNLTGEQRIAYIRQHGEDALSAQYANLQVSDYSAATSPTRREFSQKWYPDHDVDAAYKSALQDLKSSLEDQKKWQDQQVQNLNNMRSSLLRIMEEMGAQADAA